MADTNTSAPYAVAMGMLKASLGYYGAELDASIETYLGNLICYAERALTDDCGLTLVLTDPYDAGLIAMYAAWLYRKGAEGVAKPPMLQTAIRNRQVGAALAATSETVEADT